MTVSTRNLVFSWGSLLLILLLLRSSDATEVPEAFQWSRTYEEASKLEHKAPSTSVLRLIGDDPIKQNNLEYYHQMGEDPSMVNIHQQSFPRTSQSSSSNHPSSEASFTAGANMARENSGFGDMGSNLGSINANIDTYFLNPSYFTENFSLASQGDNLHYNFNENPNHINGGTFPAQILPYLPELSSNLNHNLEKDQHLFISSILGNQDHQLYDNNLVKSQNEIHYALDSDQNYQDYDRHLYQDLSSGIEKNSGHPIYQDYGTNRYQNLNTENWNFNHNPQSLHDHADFFLNVSPESALHLNLEKSDFQDLFRNVDVEKSSEKYYMKEKHPPGEDEIRGISSDDFHRHETYNILSKSGSKGSSEKSKNEGEMNTIYTDITASYIPQQSDMQINYHNSAGVHSPNAQSSSLYWPGIEEWFSYGANEVLDNLMARDFGSNSGHISTNINKENLDHSNIMKNFPFTSPEEVPSHFYSKSLNQIHGGILPEEGFSSLPEHSEDFNQCSDQGHNLYASNIYGNHDHQVHDKNLPSSVSGHHNKNYYNHIQQALSSCLDTNQANSINYNYGTYNHQNIENIENVILENIGQSIQHQTSDHSNLSCKNGLNINVDEDKGQYLMKADENEQNFENILQKKQRLTENLSFQPVKKLNTIENFTGKIHPNQSISKSKKLAVGFKHNEYKLKLDQKTRANVELNTKETLQDMENFINDLSKDHQQQDSLKLRIPDKFLPILIELENFLQKFPKPPKVKNESQFINKALLYMKWERKPEIINYALEYFFSISKIPCMSSKESFLKAVFDKQKKVFKKKAKKHPIFAVARTFYAKQMRPIDFILKIDNRWTFATVLAEIQAHLGLRLLMDSGLSSLPQKETKALKLTYENIIKKSAEKMTEVKLNQIVDNAVYSLILNIYQIDIIKQTATYFDKDIGIEDDIEKNWNLLASNWHNIESLNQVKPDPKTKGKIKKCDETNSEDLHSLLKRKMGMRSVSGKENMLNNISSINFEIWFKNNLYNTEWLTKYEKTCFSNLHLFMKHFSVADWLGRMKNL